MQSHLKPKLPDMLIAVDFRDGSSLKAMRADLYVPASKSLLKGTSTPLFLSDSPDGNKGNAQDEKDETEE
ncbi:MAG: hypothetical protein V7638_2434 [Acidobacteriota bacterium]|jgi:hypothetical protein